MAVLTGLMVVERFTENRHRLVIASLHVIIGLGPLVLALI